MCGLINDKALLKAGQQGWHDQWRSSSVLKVGRAWHSRRLGNDRGLINDEALLKAGQRAWTDQWLGTSEGWTSVAWSMTWHSWRLGNKCGLINDEALLKAGQQAWPDQWRGTPEGIFVYFINPATSSEARMFAEDCLFNMAYNQNTIFLILYHLINYI